MTQAILDQLTGDLVPLDSISESLFNNKPVVARRKAALNQLPVPAFRLGDSRRGPLYVRKADLEALVTRRYEAAQAANDKMMKAGAV